MAGSLNLHPNREHLLSLMDAARDICAAFGTPETTFEPVGYGVDASEIRHDDYFLKSEKITLKVRRSSGFSYDSLSVKVTLPQLKATVFFRLLEQAGGDRQPEYLPSRRVGKLPAWTASPGQGDSPAAARACAAKASGAPASPRGSGTAAFRSHRRQRLFLN